MLGVALKYFCLRVSARFPWKAIYDYINGPRNQFIQIDMTFNFMVLQGLPGTCLYNSFENQRNGAVHKFLDVEYFYKDMFLEVPDEKSS